MNTYTTPECPKYHSIQVFRAFNKKTRCDDGFYRVCHHESDFDDFITAGDVSDIWSGREFDKDKYYKREYSI